MLRICPRTRPQRSSGDGAALLMVPCQPSLPAAESCALFQKIGSVLLFQFQLGECFGNMRWSQKHQRPLCGDEMLGVMGLPVTKAIADAAATTLVNVNMLSESAKVACLKLHCGFLVLFGD